MFRLKWSASLNPYLAVLALAVLASWPVFIHGPVTAVDGPNHFYRLVELNWHVQHGDFYPRWFADINYGLGGPLFNYYAPLSYYVPLLLHLIGFELPTAFLLAFALAIGVAAFGAFAWASAQFQSPLAGLVAASAYVLSPYFYYNILIRGALPEAWGLALVPWLLWSAWLVAAYPGRRSYTSLTLFYAALVLSHSLSALLFTPILGVYLLTLLGLPGRANVRAWRNVVLAIALSLGLAAFFLLPFFLENSYVNLARATLDYANAFVSPSDLWAWPVPFDPHLARNPYPISLSLPVLLLAVLGLFTYLWLRRRSPGATATSFWFLLLVYAAFSLSLSAPVWALIPLGRLVQFPWRLLGPATLLLAWLAGLAVTTINSRWVWAISLVIVFLFTLTWTYTYPAESQYLPTGTPVDVIQYEESHPVALGLTYQQEFLPVWINDLSASTPNLPQYSIADPIPNRLTQTPPDIHVLQEKWLITSGEIRYQADRATTLDFDLNYFPGWAATVDGQSLVVTPAVPRAAFQ